MRGRRLACCPGGYRGPCGAWVNGSHTWVPGVLLVSRGWVLGAPSGQGGLKYYGDCAVALDAVQVLAARSAEEWPSMPLSLHAVAYAGSAGPFVEALPGGNGCCSVAVRAVLYMSRTRVHALASLHAV